MGARRRRRKIPSGAVLGFRVTRPSMPASTFAVGVIGATGAFVRASVEGPAGVSTSANALRRASFFGRFLEYSRTLDQGVASTPPPPSTSNSRQSRTGRRPCDAACGGHLVVCLVLMRLYLNRLCEMDLHAATRKGVEECRFLGPTPITGTSPPRYQQTRASTRTQASIWLVRPRPLVIELGNVVASGDGAAPPLTPAAPFLGPKP